MVVYCRMARDVVDRRLVELHLRFELSNDGLLRIELLARNGVRRNQPGVAIEVDPGVGQRRLVLRLLGDA